MHYIHLLSDIFKNTIDFFICCMFCCVGKFLETGGVRETRVRKRGSVCYMSNLTGSYINHANHQKERFLILVALYTVYCSEVEWNQYLE